MESRVYHKTISPEDPPTICDALRSLSGLSKTSIKGAMIKGAAWHQSRKSRKKRIRRATARIAPGDKIWLYYDEKILERVPPAARCHQDCLDYSIWFKPAGLMSQGTLFGDHCALIRQAEIGFKPSRPVYLIHRLDREVGGLMVLAHSRDAAARLSAMLRGRRIEKKYQARLKGIFKDQHHEGLIDLPLDGRPAVTAYKVVSIDVFNDTTTVSVDIQTGRRHQIRRHFDLIGHPVMGDPAYGRNNRFAPGLQLAAYSIGFECPFGRGWISAEIDPEIALGSVI